MTGYMVVTGVVDFKRYSESERHNQLCPYECWCLDEFAEKLARQQAVTEKLEVALSDQEYRETLLRWKRELEEDIARRKKMSALCSDEDDEESEG